MTKEVLLNWSEQKIRLKQKYAFLKESDLLFEPGKKDEMFLNLQIKLCKSKEELHAIIIGLQI